MSVKQIFNTSAELDYPTVLPTLDLDFANSKTLDPRITFTRASGGSYYGADGLIKLAGVNEARFDHDPVTGESLGFLVEEARTNFVTNSNFPSLQQQNGISNSTASSVLRPDGTVGSVSTFTVDNVAVSPYPFYRVSYLTTGNNVLHTGSVWIRAASGSHNISFGLATATGPDVAGDTTVTTSWKRLQYTRVPFGTELFLDFYTYATVNGTTFYIWGAQLEAGAFPTSHIPTTSATVTRAADVASITGKNFSSWYRQDEGTLFVNFNTPAKASSIALQVLSIRNSTPTEYIEVYTGNVNTEAITLNVAAGRQFAFYTRDTVDVGKYALALKSNNFAVSKNGLTPLTDTSGSMTSLVDRLFIGTASATGVSQLSGTIARLTYYPKRLTDAQLQVLTT